MYMYIPFYRNDLEIHFKCYHHDDKQELCNWPQGVSVRINGHPIPIDRVISCIHVHTCTCTLYMHDSGRIFFVLSGTNCEVLCQEGCFYIHVTAIILLCIVVELHVPSTPPFSCEVIKDWITK